jgi:hypothetical protein
MRKEQQQVVNHLNWRRIGEIVESLHVLNMHQKTPKARKQTSGGMRVLKIDKKFQQKSPTFLSYNFPAQNEGFKSVYYITIVIYYIQTRTITRLYITTFIQHEAHQIHTREQTLN